MALANGVCAIGLLDLEGNVLQIHHHETCRTPPGHVDYNPTLCDPRNIEGVAGGMNRAEALAVMDAFATTIRGLRQGDPAVLARHPFEHDAPTSDDDANDDGAGHLQTSSARSGAGVAADANDDGAIDLSDATSILRALFLGTGPLPAPSAEPGIDPTPDPLACGVFSSER